jgi:hypothetical protein
MDLKEIGCEHVDWIQSAQDRVQWWALNGHSNNPSGFTKSREFLYQRSYHQLLKKDCVP